MPTVHREHGFRFFFWSNERNEPPHVHVSSGDGYAKFWLDPVSLAESVGYDAREVYVLQRLVVDDREKFATMWRDYFGA